MKNLKSLALSFMLVMFVANVNAQDENNPWLISAGINAVDSYPVGGHAPYQGDNLEDFLNVDEHWNIAPSLSYLSVGRYLNDNFSFKVTGSFNILSKWGSETTEDLNYYNLDGTVSYSLSNLIKSKQWEPFIGLGSGYTWIESGPFNTDPDDFLRITMDLHL